MKKNYIAPTVDLYEYSVEDTLLVSGTGMLKFFQVEGEAEASVAADWLN